MILTFPLPIKTILVSFLLLCNFHYANAQFNCGTDTYNRLQMQNKEFLQKMQQVTNSWVAFKRNGTTSRTAEDLYTLPVVFHIIHKNGAENIPDATVMEAFQRLNDAFANRASYDQGSGVDTKIQFCMARKDPDGNFTTGITRTYADLLTVNPFVNQDLLESLIKWDPDRYINIWVVAEVELAVEFKRCNYTDFDAAGYGGGGQVVAEASVLPAIIVHEMGHALGLAHTFNGWCVNNDCLTDGDQICDTPPEETITITGGCNAPENSCHTDAQSGFTSDQLDLKTNHMDYGNGGCQHDFTQGQKERMRFVIENFLPGLLTSDVCTNDCTQPAEAEFTFNASVEYSIGNTLTFTNTSSGATAYEWFVNDDPVATTTDLTYTFPGQGWYKISLLAKPSPDEVQCRNMQVNWIRVYCSIKSEALANKKKAIVGETVHFSSTIAQVVPLPDPITYEWYENGNLFGNTASFDHSFTTPGFKIFYLVTIQGGCRDTSMKKMIDIKELPDYKLNIDHLICDNIKDNRISFSVCNEGFIDMPAGVPVTFYATNPTIGIATIVGSVFYTDEVIGKFCCKDYEMELPAGYSAKYIYGVINDDHSIATPYDLATDFPVTSFLESKYTNNLDSLSLEKFTVTITPGEATTVIGSAVTLTGTSSHPATFTWKADHGTFSCTDCNTTSFTPARYTRVILKGVSAGGCVAYDTIIVKVLANGEVFIPSGFTPNNDGVNDHFYVLGGESVARIRSFQVFNRWGEKVFSRENIVPNIPHLGWDGKLKGNPSVPGVYVYWVTVEFVNGVEKRYKGTVSLIQ
ncbi:MAG: gliding motility-associated C-terminal domain-containing protein [Chitinophagaceae bacterium]